MTRPRLTHLRGALLISLLIAVVALLALAPAAMAGPPGPTLSLAELGTKLESGPMSGYMKTTMSGYTVEDIPVTVRSLVEYSWGTLILFDSSDPAITDIGGIAEGMSGSPIYVDDGGTDKLVGAVSYGDSFTLNGMGLATPIEYMTATEDTYLPPTLTTVAPPKAGTYDLQRPVRTSEGVVSSVVIAKSAAAGQRADAASGQTVMAPLGLIEIGGLRPQSKAFLKLAKKFQKTGLTVKAASGSSAWAGAPAPDLEPGAPCAVVYTLGSVWFGGAGTITYVDDDVAMLFGHPLLWCGATEAALTGGYVSGVWADSWSPYKLIAPRDVKGAVLQDRGWGVAARIGEDVDMFPVTTHAEFTDDGVTIDDESSVSQWFASQYHYSDAPAYVIQEALMDKGDVEEMAGSAETTTTIVVADSQGHEYTISHDNLYDSDWVNWSATNDVSNALYQLAADPDGVLDAHVVSVDVDATLSSTRRSARIASVELPDGLRTGDNPVRINYYKYGSSALQTIEATLTIPPGVGVNGQLSVTPGSWGSWMDCWCCCCWCCCCSSSDGSPPQTLADLVDDLNAQPSNGDVILAFQPFSTNSDGEVDSEIDVTVPVGYVVSNYFTQSTARLHVVAHPDKLAYGGASVVDGYVRSYDDLGVNLYRQDAGSDTETLIGSVTAESQRGIAPFDALVSGLKHNCTIVARSEATDTLLPGSATDTVKVRAAIHLTCKNGRVQVRVKPGDATGKVRLQRQVGKRWVTVATLKTKGAKASYRLHKGTYVLRAHYLGCTGSAASTSKKISAVVH
jgi:hypothetical protein